MVATLEKSMHIKYRYPMQIYQAGVKVQIKYKYVSLQRVDRFLDAWCNNLFESARILVTIKADRMNNMYQSYFETSKENCNILEVF